MTDTRAGESLPGTLPIWVLTPSPHSRVSSYLEWRLGCSLRVSPQFVASGLPRCGADRSKAASFQTKTGESRFFIWRVLNPARAGDPGRDRLVAGRCERNARVGKLRAPASIALLGGPAGPASRECPGSACALLRPRAQGASCRWPSRYRPQRRRVNRGVSGATAPAAEQGRSAPWATGTPWLRAARRPPVRSETRHRPRRQPAMSED